MERFVHEGMSLGSCDTVSGKESQIFNETGVKGRIGEILKKKRRGGKIALSALSIQYLPASIFRQMGFR